MPQLATAADYLAAAPPVGQERWARLDAQVRAQTEDVELRLSYGIPTFFVAGRRLLHSGLWADHLAIYPVPETPAEDPMLVADLTAYRHGKGTLRFPYAQPWPERVIDRVVAAHLARLSRR